MNAIASLTIANGMVTMTEADWHALLDSMEDADDLAVARAAKMEAEADPFRWTLQESLAMIEHDSHPITVLRARTGMARTKLAELSGVSQAYIAKIEARQKPGSVKAMMAIAKALGVTVEVIAK